MLHTFHHDRNYLASLDAERPRSEGPCDLRRMVSAARHGDQIAWSALVARFRARVTRTARSLGLNPYEADDVAQETWLELYRSLESVRDPQALGAWLETTARHTSLRMLRRKRREEPTCDEIWRPEPSVDDSCAEIMQDRRAALSDALETLPQRHRLLMELLLSDPRPSYAELSTRLNIPIGSIGPIRGRCIERLRRELLAASTRG
jgi:RNA polymerase sigma factor (sigma-70 family)